MATDGTRTATSLALAAGLHASGIVWISLHELPEPGMSSCDARADTVEVSLVVMPTPVPPTDAVPHRSNELALRRYELVHSTGPSRQRTLLAEQGGDWSLLVPDAVDAGSGEAAAVTELQAPTASSHRLSLEALGISGAAHRSQLMDLYRDPPVEPDVGGLRSGLAARDAARGYGSSGAAVSAAHGAALAQGPKSGTALFDVLVDREGRVQSVTIVHARPDLDAWQAVARELVARLGGRKLRVPPNGNGVRTRLEVAIGDDARELQQRAEPEPLVKRDGFRENAVGETRLPARTARTESTREHIYGDPGALSPTLGVGAPARSGAKAVGRSRRVWVRVLGETQL